MSSHLSRLTTPLDLTLFPFPFPLFPTGGSARLKGDRLGDRGACLLCSLTRSSSLFSSSLLFSLLRERDLLRFDPEAAASRERCLCSLLFLGLLLDLLLFLGFSFDSSTPRAGSASLLLSLEAPALFSACSTMGSVSTASSSSSS